MNRSDGQILTTHAGSLPRTDGLVALLAAMSRGEPVDTDAFRSQVETSTRLAVRRQAEAGIHVGNGGEQPRISFSTYVTLRMTGFGGSGQRMLQKDLAEYPGVIAHRAVDMQNTPRCVGPVKYESLEEAERECDDLLAHACGDKPLFEECFMTAASPGIVALTMLNDYYDSYEAYLFALAEEMRKEYELIASKGLVLQLDCPDLAMERHMSQRDRPIETFRELVRLNIRALNHAIRNIPRDSVRLHVCWGNYEGPHHYDVPLAEILPLVYEANVGALVLEMANPRHAHEHRVFQQYPLPDHMVLVAGVIDTKTNYIEHPEVVADRIGLAVQAVGDPTRVIAGTDCGFDTAAGSRRVDREIAWEKLRTLWHGAAIAGQAIAW